MLTVPVSVTDPDSEEEFHGSRGGALHRIDARHQALCFERRLEHPVAEVWPHLVRPPLLARWWAVAERLEQTEGGSLRLRWPDADAEGRYREARGFVSRYEPPTLVEFELHPHGRVRFELQDEGGGAALDFSVTLPAPVERPALLLAGWHVHLDLLARALAGAGADRTQASPADSWQSLYADYAAAYGA